MLIHSSFQALVIDGKLQSAEIDEFIYHESLVHPALLHHPKYDFFFFFSVSFFLLLLTVI